MTSQSKSACKTVMANIVAKKFVDEIVTNVKLFSKPPLLVGFLASKDPASKLYAEFTSKVATSVGIVYELRECKKEELEEKIIEANQDKTIDGILIYFPIFGTGQDHYLQDVVCKDKDVEGVSKFHMQNMYHNIRYLDPPNNTQKSIIPCTPLAIVKVLEYLNIYNTHLEYGNRLYGKTVVIINRSEVVGRPLAALLANDGAKVYSVDINDILLFTRGKGILQLLFQVSETNETLENVLPLADVIIAGVPSANYKVPAQYIKDGATCINFSSEKNFDHEEIKNKAGIYVPNIGKVTITMLLRNLIKLKEYGIANMQ